jgi:hypothetical protein
MADHPTADVIPLPTAAREPVLNHRRPGSYGRKVTSLRSHKWRRDSEAQKSEPADLEATLEEMRQLASAGKLHGLVFVVDVGDNLYKAGVVGTLKDNWDPAREAWVKLDWAMFTAGKE